MWYSRQRGSEAAGSEESAGGSEGVNNYEQVLVALRRVIRATDLHSKQLSKHSGLTGPQLLIMRTIRGLGEVTIGTIADKVSLSQATVTTILDRLEHRNLVYRVRNTRDKRKVHAHLTDEGGDKLNRAPQPLQEEFIQRFHGLHQWEQTMIIASLQRVASMMDADDIDASPVLDVGPVLREDGWKGGARKPSSADS
ncbi:MAG: MarR family transcriptional regulator [Oleiphilaceae bacterium]|nr:MarR family transcriptional regulator [Oleiphilaceae bacterium]